MDKGYYKNSQHIDVQGSISGEQRHRWHIHLTPTYKVQGPLWEREQKDCKRQRFESTGENSIFWTWLENWVPDLTHTRAKQSIL